MRVLLGLAIAILVASLPLRLWYRLAWVGWFLGVGLLVATEWFGVTVNQATRWLPIFGSLQIQPSELMRIALIVVLARWFSGFRHGEVSRKPWLLLPPLLLIVIPVLLVLRQPDLGTGLILAVLGISMIFMAGLHWAYFLIGACGLVASAPLLWAQLHEYQQRRVLTFLNPESDPLGSGYHILQSKIALGLRRDFWQRLSGRHTGTAGFSTRKTHRFYLHHTSRRIRLNRRSYANRLLSVFLYCPAVNRRTMQKFLL